MNVKRIIVDELPENCSTCIFAVSDKDGDEICIADGYCDKQIDTERKTRPSWCPLVVEEVCEWQREKTDRGYAAFYIPKDHEQHLDCYTQDACTFEFCPSCGKRIVYKESEE